MNFLQYDDSYKVQEHKINEDITIWDNFLEPPDFETLKQLVTHQFESGLIRWRHSSVGFHPYTYCHFSTDLTNIPFFNSFMLQKLEKNTNKTFKILRIYSSIQKPAEFGNFHTDDSKKNTYTFTTYFSLSNNSIGKESSYEDYNFSFSPYNINTENSPFNFEKYKNIYSEHNEYDLDNVCEKFTEYNINGNFSIKSNSKEHTEFFHTVPYIENRAVFFPSYLLHDGNSFNANLTRIRCVVAFKLQEIC